MEIWKDVVGYEDSYEVSNSGNVRSKTRYTNHRIYGKKKVEGKLLKKMKGFTSKKSPLLRFQVELYKDGQRRRFSISRLVAEAFIPNPENKTDVNHIDGVPSNNKVGNLEWCTSSENINHAFDNRLIKSGKEIILLNKKTKEMHYFRSQMKASLFLGRYKKYLSDKILRGDTEVGEYYIFHK
ncbi:NUMOD4 domain-containing protein [Virgibacillus salexigens]|uniref:NUMOD4 domain-containing protein n=1 Tax=Virgibacillus salexigens TaxID=61016 RepID=UPI00190A36DD|nr:NUMOD4 domain-containing protein [Virgibacillus salexigens]